MPDAANTPAETADAAAGLRQAPGATDREDEEKVADTAPAAASLTSESPSSATDANGDGAQDQQTGDDVKKPGASLLQTPIKESEYDKYMLRSPVEVFTVLRELFEHVSQISIFPNSGDNMLLTTLALVKKDQLILDYGPDDSINRLALTAKRLFCVAFLNKVRVQFFLPRLQATEYQGRPSFLSDPPEELLRLQRREFFRLAASILKPLQCELQLPLDNGDADRVMVDVSDISCGGLCITSPPDHPSFDVQARLPGCRVELPGGDWVSGELEVRSIFQEQLKNGAWVKRAGCAFVNLPGPVASQIQRHIVRVEREMKARRSGLS